MVIYTKTAKSAKKVIKKATTPTTTEKKVTKDPRVTVSLKRLQQLRKVAKREKSTVKDIVEVIFSESTLL